MTGGQIPELQPDDDLVTAFVSPGWVEFYDDHPRLDPDLVDQLLGHAERVLFPPTIPACLAGPNAPRDDERP